jgi:xylulokinase
VADQALIGIDLGTTGIKVGVCSPDGRLLSLAARQYPMEHPSPGAAEQDPAAWWAALVATTRQAMTDVSVEVTAITVAGQGPTLVAVDASDAPVRRAICWMDTRANSEQAELSDKLGLDGFLLGNLPKIAWMNRHEPSLAANVRWFLSAWDYLTMKLAGRAITAMPVTGSQASPDLAAAAGLDAMRIPETVAWGTVIGKLTASAAAELSLPAACSVVAGANDALASYAGSGVKAAGQSINNSGTSGGFAVYWQDETSIPGVYSIPAIVPGLRLFGGAMSATGLSLDWLRRVAGPELSVETILAEAATAPPGSDGLVYLPYLAGERSPLWDGDARASFVGLETRHTRAHLARAVLEAAGYAIRHVAEPIVQAGVVVSEMRPCGGGAKSDIWNQVKADTTGFPVAVPEVVETAVVGAGILGSVGLGYRSDIEEAMTAMVRVRRRYEPQAEAVERHAELYSVYRKLYPALKDSFDDLAAYRAMHTS